MGRDAARGAMHGAVGTGMQHGGRCMGRWAWGCNAGCCNGAAARQGAALTCMLCCRASGQRRSSGSATASRRPSTLRCCRTSADSSCGVGEGGDAAHGAALHGAAAVQEGAAPGPTLCSASCASNACRSSCTAPAASTRSCSSSRRRSSDCRNCCSCSTYDTLTHAAESGVPPPPPPFPPPMSTAPPGGAAPTAGTAAAAAHATLSPTQQRVALPPLIPPYGHSPARQCISDCRNCCSCSARNTLTHAAECGTPPRYPPL